MTRGCFLVLTMFLLFFLTSSYAQTVNKTDLQLAMNDMRSQSYDGFVILLKMLNSTSFPYRGITLFMPSDSQISGTSVSVDNIEVFMLRHSIRMPLSFEELAHFPNGSLVPSLFHNHLLRIQNQGNASFYIENARIMSRNVCLKSRIKCHGIDAVITYDNNQNNNNNDGP
ncbi:uncharacterized protein LOC124935037 [Impatiens glandulifera]|uniref:uncharacterized protein LOC124935037 n=1 Tax=Impatiens glandulifera TaxID=253017 RepID=UPI001FB051E9|nr:uncharacterized protein LOC124935037 [Impatiens glandulifera]